MATLKDVARQAGVSTATVSKVVNNVDTYMSPETRRKVEKALSDCGYQPNTVARGLKTRRTNTIGFILPDITNPFYAEIAKGIETAAKNLGYSLIICDSEIDLEEEIVSIELLKTKMVDGIILGTRAFLSDEIDIKLFDKIPVVVIGRSAEDVQNRNWGAIVIEEKKMIGQSVARLKKAGCRHIGLITSAELGNVAMNVRLQGFLQAMKQFGMEINDKLIYLDEYDMKTGYQGLRELLAQGTPVDGIVCGNDMIALGVMDAAKEEGIRIPEELKIIGFDDIFFARYMTPKLSTIAQPAYEMGREAVQMLISWIEQKVEPGIKKMECIYVERETV